MRNIHFFFITILAFLLLTTVSSCKKENPEDKSTKACFTISAEEITPGQTVTFTNCSKNATSLTWDFSDGSQQQGSDVVTKTINTTGNYTMRLTASGPQGINSLEHGLVVAYPVQACIYVQNPTGIINSPIQFNSCSASTSAQQWNFGDGTTSTEQSPIHTYTTAGNYTVTLTATSLGGHFTATTTKSISIYDTPGANLAGPHYSGNDCGINNSAMWVETNGNNINIRYVSLANSFYFDMQGTFDAANHTITIPQQTHSNGGGNDITIQGSGTFTDAPVINITYHYTLPWGSGDCALDIHKY